MSNKAFGIIAEGHGVASGKAGDIRFPFGTLAMQIPIFERRGMDFKQFFKGTINISLNSSNFELRNPKFFFKGIKWSHDLPPENFSFFACSLKVNSSPLRYGAFVYWPHPSTKPEFHQDEKILEVISAYIPSIKYGDEIEISAHPDSIYFHPLSLNSEKSG
ncbi:MAG: hypothetical protein CMI23_09370 [Opitutae bacterium]|nr:hypothetical protein [Opitutae bacterium]